MNRIELLVERFHALNVSRTARHEADRLRIEAQHADEVAIKHLSRAHELERYLAETEAAP
jgi:hypothetical protein